MKIIYKISFYIKLHIWNIRDAYNNIELSLYNMSFLCNVSKFILLHLVATNYNIIKIIFNMKFCIGKSL